MEYLKLQRSFRTTEAWQVATAAARGAWVSVAGYCADEENGGRIAGAKAWTTRLWMQRAGVTAEEVADAVAAHLATWDGDDLVVGGYDLVGEKTYQARRQGGRDASPPGINPRTGEPARGTRTGNPSGQPTPEPIRVQDGEPIRATRAGNPSPTPQSPVSSLHEPETLPSPPSSDVSPRTPAKPAPARGGANARIQAVDPQEVASAIAGRSLPRLLAAFCADLTDGAGWRRETNGLALGQVAHVLAWRFARRDPIRQPSGWRRAWEAWQALDADEARAAATANHDLLGLPLPKSASGAA